MVWIAALTGGLAGAILTLFGNWFLTWRNRPILQIDFNEKEPPGCSVTTPAFLRENQGEPLRDELGNPRKFQQHYLRPKVKNIGKTFAKNVSVCVPHISYRKGGAGERIFAEEVFDLKLALAGRPVFNLASHGHRFVDLVHVQQEAGRKIELAFDFVGSAVRLQDMEFASGTYEMKVFVSAENANAVEYDLSWSWNGTLDTLKCVSIVQSS